MTRTLAFVAMTMVLVTVAGAAEPRYDHNLERAAARIAAAKMGDIRGGFSFRDKPQFVVVRSAPAMTTASGGVPADPPDDSLMPAVEGPAGSFLN